MGAQRRRPRVLSTACRFSATSRPRQPSPPLTAALAGTTERCSSIGERARFGRSQPCDRGWLVCRPELPNEVNFPTRTSSARTLKRAARGRLHFPVLTGSSAHEPIRIGARTALSARSFGQYPNHTADKAVRAPAVLSQSRPCSNASSTSGSRTSTQRPTISKPAMRCPSATIALMASVNSYSPRGDLRSRAVKSNSSGRKM